MHILFTGKSRLSHLFQVSFEGFLGEFYGSFACVYCIALLFVTWFSYQFLPSDLL